MVGERGDDVRGPHCRCIDGDLVDRREDRPLAIVEAGDVQPRRTRVRDPCDEVGTHRLE
jgi:hypothetical protein